MGHGDRDGRPIEKRAIGSINRRSKKTPRVKNNYLKTHRL
jgi:hypothetical protein